MSIVATLRQEIDAIAVRLHDVLPAYLTWLSTPAKRTLEYFCAPFLFDGGRFPWWGLVIALGIAILAFALDRKRADGGWLRYCFPREIYRNPSTWIDLKIGFFNYVLYGGGVLNVTWRLTSAWFASWITFLLTAGFGPNNHPVSWGPAWIVVFTLVISLASDFGYFLYHWLSHVFPPMWAIHKLHHSAEVMTPLTAARVHILEIPLMGPFMAATTGLVVGPLLWLHGGETGVATIFGLDIAGVLFFALGHNLHHSHIWVYFGPIIGRVIVSPAQHQIHHSCLPRHIDKNFAEHWAIWDTLFGTLYLPNGRETLKLGLAGYQTQIHPGVVAANVRPVYDSVVATISMGRRWVRWLGRLEQSDDHPDARLMTESSPDEVQGFAHPPGPGR